MFSFLFGGKKKRVEPEPVTTTLNAVPVQQTVRAPSVMDQQLAALEAM